MNESIKQGLIMAVAGIMFAIAVTIFMWELKAVADLEAASAVRDPVIEAEAERR